MDKATRSYIRIERIDGKQVGLILDCDKGNEEELLAMLGDGLADWIVKNPDKYTTARRFTKRVLEDLIQTGLLTGSTDGRCVWSAVRRCLGCFMGLLP